MTEHESQPGKVLSFLNSNTFSMLARILGFVVDSIAIASILLATPVSGGKPTFIFSSIEIMPVHALPLWVLAAYLYVCWLKLYWDRNKTVGHLRPIFRDFLKSDLVLEFKEPFRLLPAVVLAILLVWISLITGWICVLPLVLSVCFLPLIVVGIGVELDKQRRIRAFERDVDERWEEWEEQVRTRLSKQGRLDTYDMEAFAGSWGIDTKDLKYVLREYATVHPEVTYSEDYGGEIIVEYENC